MPHLDQPDLGALHAGVSATHLPRFALGPSKVLLGPGATPGPISLAPSPLQPVGLTGARPTPDHVTGLPDRVAFLDRLPATLVMGPSALVVLKLDRLAVINDTLGHAVGDGMLRAAATRLRGGVRKPDLIGSLGGAAFAVLIPDVATDEVAANLAGRLVEALCQPYPLQAALAVSGAMAGFALAPRDGTRPDDLLRRAGLALDSGGADPGFARAIAFSPGLERDAHARLCTEAALRCAIPRGELELLYQPQVSTAHGEVRGFEALLRWRRDGALVAPGSFLPAAEASGLILQIGEWVLREACRTAMAWPEEISISVNVAALQFADGRLVQTVQSVLAATGLQPSRLELEVTESALLRHGADTLDQLRALRATGVRIAMDDFGTGFASLSQLHAFPFDRLKIDRAFVGEIEQGGSAAAIVATIAELGGRMGLETVGEGVETSAQLHWLRDHGCTIAQGFMLGHPMPAARVAALLTAEQAA